MFDDLVETASRMWGDVDFADYAESLNICTAMLGLCVVLT